MTLSISAVVTTYNSAAYLGQALDSVFAQTYPVAEVIVLDDGSADDGATARVAQGYGARVRYIYQANGGCGAARNAGAAAASGTHLAWLDGDDYWAADKLERQVAVLTADPTVKAVFAHAHQFISPELAGAEAARLDVPEAAMPGRYASTLLLARAAFERVGPFATDMAVSEFIDWYARAVEHGLRIVMLPEALVWRRVHGNNNSRRRAQERSEYARVLKAALDRRRAASAKPGGAAQ